MNEAQDKARGEGRYDGELGYMMSLKKYEDNHYLRSHYVQGWRVGHENHIRWMKRAIGGHKSPWLQQNAN